MDRCYDAAAAADSAIALRPTWADAHLARARALLNYGEPDDALHSFRRAAALAPGDDDVRAECVAAEVLRCKAALRCTVEAPMDEG